MGPAKHASTRQRRTKLARNAGSNAVIRPAVGRRGRCGSSADANWSAMAVQQGRHPPPRAPPAAMSDEVDKHVLRKYDISQKMGKGVSPLAAARGSPPVPIRCLPGLWRASLPCLRTSPGARPVTQRGKHDALSRRARSECPNLRLRLVLQGRMPLTLRGHELAPRALSLPLHDGIDLRWPVATCGVAISAILWALCSLAGIWHRVEGRRPPLRSGRCAQKVFRRVSQRHR